jgi:hypothetical protein
MIQAQFHYQHPTGRRKTVALYLSILADKKRWAKISLTALYT